MAARIITIQIQGAPEDDYHVRLSDLLKKLESLRTALRQTEGLVTGDDSSIVEYRVVNLSHNSPATLVLEAVPIDPRMHRSIATTTVNKFISNLNQILSKGKVSNKVDSHTLESYRNLASSEQRITEFKITSNKQSIEIDNLFKEKVTEIIGEDETELGSVSGQLEWLNLHNNNTFHIYPTVGAKKINCSFRAALKAQVISAIDQHVRVFGELRYKKRDKFPYAMNVSDLEILPSDSELPTLASLKGIAKVKLAA